MKALHKYIQCDCSLLLATCSCKYQRSMCIATGVTSITRNREIFLCSSCLFFSSPNVHNQYIQIQLCLPLFHMSLLKGQDPHPGTGRPAPTLYPPVSCLGSGLQNAPPATCRQILSSLSAGSTGKAVASFHQEVQTGKEQVQLTCVCFQHLKTGYFVLAKTLVSWMPDNKGLFIFFGGMRLSIYSPILQCVVLTIFSNKNFWLWVFWFCLYVLSFLFFKILAFHSTIFHFMLTSLPIPPALFFLDINGRLETF